MTEQSWIFSCECSQRLYIQDWQTNKTFTLHSVFFLQNIPNVTWKHASLTTKLQTLLQKVGHIHLNLNAFKSHFFQFWSHINLLNLQRGEMSSAGYCACISQIKNMNDSMAKTQIQSCDAKLCWESRTEWKWWMSQRRTKWLRILHQNRPTCAAVFAEMIWLLPSLILGLMFVYKS